MNRSPLAGILISVVSAWLCSCEGGREGGSTYCDQSICDDSGTAVALPAEPRRVVSLLPSITASIVKLGALDRIAGATRWCRLPAGAQGVTIVGDMLRPDIEKIVSLAPDVVFASMEGSSRPHIEKMRAEGVTVFVFGESRTFSDMEEQFRRLGRILGLGDRAEGIAAEARARVESVRKRVGGAPRPKALVELGDSPLISCSEGSYNHEMIEIAGGINVAAGLRKRYPEVPLEKVLLDDPDVIVVVDMAGMGSAAADKWKEFPSLSAVKAGRVHLISADLICHPTPFEFADGLEALARLLHPGLPEGR